MITEKYYASRIKGPGLFQLVEERDNSLVRFFGDCIRAVADIVDPRHHEEEFFL
jgi:hypothetical protein